MAEFAFFEVTGFYEVLVSDGPDAGTEPDSGIITGIVTFTPEISVVATEGLTPQTMAILQPLQARIEEDGVLKSIDGTPGVKLPANNDAIGLPELRYKVEYSQMKWDKQSRTLDGFTFVAPTTAVTKDIRELYKARV